MSTECREHGDFYEIFDESTACWLEFCGHCHSFVSFSDEH